MPTISRNNTDIEFSLPQSTKVYLVVYDVLGRLTKTIVSKKFSPGNHRIDFNLNLPSGIYFYHLKTTSGEDIIQKFLLIE